MFTAVFLQFGATLIAAGLMGFFVGMSGVCSVLWAGFACILPNALFALRLKSMAGRPGASYPVNFFIGEFVKIAATLGLLAVAIRVYPEMHWPSLIFGFVVALQASFIAFWKKS